MKFIERLAQWISDFLFGEDEDYSTRLEREYQEALKKHEAEKKRKRQIEPAPPAKSIGERFHEITEADLESLEKVLSKKPKTADEKAMKKKKVVTKKKTEGKAATKAKPARDANGRFVKQS